MSAQLPLIGLLYQYNTLRSLRQFLQLLSAERPKICVVRVRDPPLSQFLAAYYVLYRITGAPPADHEQLDLVASTIAPRSSLSSPLRIIELQEACFCFFKKDLTGLRQR